MVIRVPGKINSEISKISRISKVMIRVATFPDYFFLWKGMKLQLLVPKEGEG